jgi:O-antigen/teichoic acid export membrane protein
VSSPLVDVPRRGFRAPGTGFMVGGGLVGAFGAYVFQWYGTQRLSADEFAPVGVLWTLFFILATILLVPVEQYVTREVASGRRALPGALKPMFVMAAIGGLIGGGVVVATLDRWFYGDPQYIAQIVLLTLGYGLLFMGKGVLAGSRRFAGVGWVMIVETVARLVAGVVLLWVLLDATSMGWAMVIGGFSILALRWWRHDQGATESAASPAGVFLLGYVGGTAPSQLLLAGAPLAVALLGAPPETVSVIFITFTLFRAPLTLIYALQGRILPYLVGLDRSGDRPRLAKIARNVVLGGTALALLGGLVGWLVGPTVVSALYGGEYTPAHMVAGLAAAGVMAAATAQIASQVLVAEGKTRALGPAWAGGLLVAAVATLLAGGVPEVRVAIGFVTGEFAALGLMALLAIRR